MDKNYSQEKGGEGDEEKSLQQAQGPKSRNWLRHATYLRRRLRREPNIVGGDSSCFFSSHISQKIKKEKTTMNHPRLIRGAKIRKEEFGGILRAPIQSVLKTGQTFYLLSEVEFLILSNLGTGSNTIREITEKVANEFDAKLEEAADDVSDYLKGLEKFGIVVYT